MAPGRKLFASTPAGPNVTEFFNDNQAPSDIVSPIKKKSTYLEMTKEAIIAIGLPRKGASYQAIKKWIIANKEVDIPRLNTNLKLAVKKGLDKGILVRPKRFEAAVGATGHLMLASKKPAKSSRKMVPLKAGKKVPPTEAGGESTEAGRGKKMISKKSPAKAEKPAKPPSKAAAKEPATKAPSKAVTKEPATRAHSKDVAKEPATRAHSKAAAKKPATKAPLKGEAKKKPVTEAPLKGEAKKKPVTEAPLKGEAKKMPVTEAPSKVGTKSNSLDETRPGIFFSDSESDEDQGNAEVIAETQKNGKLDKSKPVQVEAEPVKREEKIVKGTKKLPKPDTVRKGQKIAKTAGNKLYASENELERQDFSNSEIVVKKKHRQHLKSFSSDTELEVSKREEKKAKKVLRDRKNISNISKA